MRYNERQHMTATRHLAEMIEGQDLRSLSAETYSRYAGIAATLLDALPEYEEEPPAPVAPSPASSMDLIQLHLEQVEGAMIELGGGGEYPNTYTITRGLEAALNGVRELLRIEESRR